MATTLTDKKKGTVTGSAGTSGISGAVPGTQQQQLLSQLQQKAAQTGSGSAPAISGVYVGSKTQNPMTAKTETPSPYTGLEGVSDNTAKQTGRYQQDYQAGDAVMKAQQALEAIQAQKPQGYTSKYADQLDGILQRITNPEKFKYEFNGDNLFRSYADYYTQMGKQASQDAMGQAAALTGGYGNTYAQNAGQQAYQQYLLGLYDKGLDLYDRAYQRYQDEQNANLNQYNVLANADQTDYGRYRDEYGDWQNERDYYTGRYDTEADRDYSRWTGNRDYWTGLAQVENADYRSEQERQEAIRQYNESTANQKAQEDRQYAYNYAMTIIGNGQMPSKQILKLAGLSEEDAKKMIKQASSGGGGGGRKTTTPERVTDYYVTNTDPTMKSQWHPDNEMTPDQEQELAKKTGDKIKAGDKVTSNSGADKIYGEDTVSGNGGNDLLPPSANTKKGTSTAAEKKKNRNVSVK